jgi:hypothetical protein
MRPVNLSIRMVAVRRGRRQEEEEEEEQSKVYSSTGESISFFLQSSSVPQKRPQPPPNYTTVGSLTLPLPLLLTGTSAMGQAQLLQSSYITATLGAEKGCEKAALPLVKPPSATGLAQSLTRWSATFDTVFRRPGTGKVPDQCSNHRSPRRSPRSKNGSRFSRPEGPGHSNCKELLQPVGPLLPPSQTLEYIGSLLRFVLHPQLFSNSHRPRQSSGSARHTGSRWCHMAPQSFLPQFFIALKVWYRRGS